MSRDFRNRNVIVTGASRGIGNRIASVLAAKGARVAAISRTESRLRELADAIRQAGGICEPIPADLTKPGDRNRAVAHAMKALGGIDGLINAAGVAAHGPFESGTEDVLRAVMEINFFAAAEMIRACVPALTESAASGNQPVIVNIASVVGRFGIPGVSEHSASKHALIGLSESIRAEFVRFGIDVLVAAPSVVKTDDPESHLLRNEPMTPVDFERGMDPDEVARLIVRAAERNTTEAYLGRQAWWVNLGRRLGPRVMRKIMWRKFGIHQS